MKFTDAPKHTETRNVYVIQDIPGSKVGTPKINIIGATQFGNLKVCLPENSQIILSPTYVITTLRNKLKNYFKSINFLVLVKLFVSMNKKEENISNTC